MVLKESVTPVTLTARRVLHVLRQPLGKELDQMAATGIIARTEEPSDLVSPLAIVRKKGQHDQNLHGPQVY